MVLPIGQTKLSHSSYNGASATVFIAQGIIAEICYIRYFPSSM